MQLSPAQLEILRTRPQGTRLSLSIFQPRIIFQARVNDSSIARGARNITYDTVSLGSFSAIESGFTLLIGTTAGAQDVGKLRTRSATSSVITVSENSNIAWADNLFLTVLRYVELWPVYPRIINDPANIENVIFYKDYDIPYTNQNSILGSFACAGPHRAAYLVNGSTQLYWQGNRSEPLLNDSLSYAWTFEGGTPTGSSSVTPGYVTYNTPGHYVTRLIVSGSSGGVDTTYRYVSIYQKPSDGTNVPVLKWEMGNLNGSRDEGGYKVNIKVYEDVDLDENSVVVLFADDWYGNTNQSLGGNADNSEKIFFVGYILRDSIHYDYQHSFVEFDVGSITELMKQSLGFSVSVESKATPTKWYELLELDCRRAMYHYLKWHTTVLNIADFQFFGNDQKIQFFDADRASMFDAIDNLMRNTLIGSVVSDRQGGIYAEVEAKAYPNPTGTFPYAMELTRRDWMNEPSIEERLSDDLSYLEYGGIAYSGVATGTFSAILGSAPGATPSFRGKIETHEGLALESQTQLNQLVGNVWANENVPYPTIGLDMAINASHLDIAPQDPVNLIIQASDTVRGVPIQGLYLPSSFDWRYDAKNGILLPQIDFKNLVNGAVGESIFIDVSPDDFEGGNSVPGLQIPPLPILTIPPGLTQIIQNIINASGGGGLQPYGSIGWYDNTFHQDISGINVQQAVRGAGSGEIDITVDEDGWYIMTATVGQTWSSATGNPNGTLTVGIQGGKTSFVMITTPVDSLGNSFGSASATVIVQAFPGLVLDAIWAVGNIGGSSTAASPRTFSLEIHKVSE